MRIFRHPEPARRSGTADEGGFSLLEVMVALVLVALVLVTLFRATSTGVLATSRADTAVALASAARSLLDRAGADVPLVEGRQEGTDADGVRWTLETTLADEVAGTARLWSLTLTVDLDGLRRRITTHRAEALGTAGR